MKDNYTYVIGIIFQTFWKDEFTNKYNQNCTHELQIILLLINFSLNIDLRNKHCCVFLGRKEFKREIIRNKT